MNHDSLNQPTILVVDDEATVADTLAEILRRTGYIVFAAYSAEDALRIVRQHTPELMIADVIMSDIDGVQLAIQVHELHPDTRILLFSGNASTLRLVEQAYEKGFDFELLAKPMPPRQMIEKVASIFEDAKVVSTLS